MEFLQFSFIKLAFASYSLDYYFGALIIIFHFFLKLENLPLIAGLILGGVIAAPFAAKLCKILPSKTMMRLVGILLILVSKHESKAREKRQCSEGWSDPGEERQEDAATTTLDREGEAV